MLTQALIGSAVLLATPSPSPAQVQAPAPPPADEVAAAVDQSFATYDTNGDGKLDEVEFGAWMVRLKAETDPRIDPDAPATRRWNRAAFAQADVDRNNALTKAEVTGFLTPAARS